VRQW